MINKIRNKIHVTLIALLAIIGAIQYGYAQSSGVSVKGVVIESATGEPLKQVTISAAATGRTADTNENGEFTIEVPDLQSELTIFLPGYVKRQIFIKGKDNLRITLVSDQYKTFDNSLNKPLGSAYIKDETYSVSSVTADQILLSKATSFDQALQGKVAGLQIIEQSGMPGQKTFMNIRGTNSLVGRNEPLLIIDGMIHDYNYAHYGLIEGFNLNPFDIVDIDDISDLSILKTGDSHLGSAGSNGVIFLNTEQKSEASTLIKISGYGGISFTPKKLDVLDANQFNQYFNGYLDAQGLTQGQRERMYPWLASNGDDKYKYANNTDWQKEIYKPGLLQKYHIFLKGGDDIATYNISTGFLNHDAAFSGTGYNRFNLRVNGKINISNKFSITPNVKLSLADSYTPSLGHTTEWNPVISAILKPAIMAPNARDKATGEPLPYLDDEGVFGVSNPSALVKNAVGINRNYHFLSSVNAIYKFNEHLSISNLLGINFNNSRENIFIPNIGVVQIDSAANTPMDFVYEFRSTQNHTKISYNNKTSDGRTIDVQAGVRYMANTYKHNEVIDLNTPSDDFKNLGQGSKYNYLRQALGDNRNLVWMSYFANGNYSIKNKYFFNANLSVDGSSVLNSKNRTNIFPSVGAAWRLSSEEFMADSKLEDLKLRASVSMTGNMYSSIYDFSKLYYNEVRINSTGVLTRNSIPNEDLQLEKTTTANFGIDVSGKRQLFNLHADVYYGLTNNLIIEQELPSGYGFTTYYDNGGSLSNLGAEIAADYRKVFGNAALTISGTASSQISMINSLNFIAESQNSIITSVYGADYITSAGNVLNNFYGYKTEGIFQSKEEANQYIGPKGAKMQAGDIKYVDLNNDKVINSKDKQIIGNPNPFLFGGLFADLTFNRWEIRAGFNYSIGNSAFNYVRYKGESMDTYASQLSTVLDHWTSNNTGADLPRVSFGDPTGNTVFSDRWIEDASYFKFKNLTVAYQLPETGFYSGIKLYMTVSNLLTLTKYSGYDPEFYYVNDPFLMGIDYGKMPQTRSFIIGVKLDL